MAKTIGRASCAAAAIAAAAITLSAQASSRAPFAAGTRVMLDAHNAYPYNGRFADRIDRALATGLPVAIEQDLVWRPAAGGGQGRSVVSHGEPFDDREPALREYFFERIRPIVEQAFRDGSTEHWPLVTLNLDLKSNEPEHHRALWELLGEYEGWLTTAERTADAATPAPLTVKPVLVLTGESDAQARAFHDAIPVGSRLRLFGALPIRPPVAPDADKHAAAMKFWYGLPTMALPKATNYRRWWNAPWSVVEAGGQAAVGDWDAADDVRLRTLVRRAHASGLWVRLWTVNGHDHGAEAATGWSTGYNVGSLEAARVRWRASVAAGVDFIASDQYELVADVLPEGRPRLPAPRQIVIAGTLDDTDRLTWIERPFGVPPGTARVDIETTYTDRDQGTAIEFGLYDPIRFRGASRTSKTQFFVSRTAATPSYAAGDLPAGTWRVLMGVPSLRAGGGSTYRLVIRLTPDGPSQPSPLAVPDAIAHTGPRWYQGDLHAHTQHSDGFGCRDAEGGDRPCTAHLIAEAARRRGLDFVAVTDHNTTSHHAGMVDVQARYPAVLLLRGQEMTTFYGHANIYGISEVLDFRIGPKGPAVSEVFRAARRLGALVSINHPGRETGDRCTGCGWNAPDTDYGAVDAIEVVNGGNVAGPTAGTPFWHARLNQGYRVTGVGGGDDHGGGTRPGSGVGTPTTVVYADALTETALLAGIRRGHVYVKTRGPEGPDLRFTAPALGAAMGDAAAVPAGGADVRFHAAVLRGRGQRIAVIRSGVEVAGLTLAPLATDDEIVEFALRPSPGEWVRVNIVDEAGVTVMGNPIYFR